MELPPITHSRSICSLKGEEVKRVTASSKDLHTVAAFPRSLKKFSYEKFVKKFGG